jgi:hypothetical protein
MAWDRLDALDAVAIEDNAVTLKPVFSIRRVTNDDIHVMHPVALYQADSVIHE